MNATLRAANGKACKGRSPCASFEGADDRESDPFHSFSECRWLVTGKLVVGVWRGSLWRAVQHGPPVSLTWRPLTAIFPIRIISRCLPKYKFN